MRNGAIKSYNTAVLWSPWEDRQSVWIWMKEEVTVRYIRESINGRGVKGNAVFKGTTQFVWHDGNIFLIALQINEGKTDEFDILFFHVFDDFFWGVVHKNLL